MIFVKRSELPAPVRGKVGILSVAITGNGQIQLSKMAIEAMGKPESVVPALDPAKDGASAKLYLFKTDSAFVVKSKATEDSFYKLSYPKNGKGGGAFFSGANALRLSFGGFYDFKTSGNQTFTPVLDEKNGALVVTLPKGSLAPKPVVKRTKKVVAPGIAAVPGSTSGTPVNQAGDELSLDAA